MIGVFLKYNMTLNCCGHCFMPVLEPLIALSSDNIFSQVSELEFIDRHSIMCKLC